MAIHVCILVGCCSPLQQQGSSRFWDIQGKFHINLISVSQGTVLYSSEPGHVIVWHTE
jgi:hypothetical protein